MKINCIKKYEFLVVLFFINFLNLSAKEIILGGSNGWSDFQSEENITKGKGRFGYDCIQLDTNSFSVDENTDLLIDFESQDSPIVYGNYKIISNGLKSSNQTKMGKLAGLSRNLGGLYILGNSGSFFGSEGLHSSFTIEFWLNPSLVENGENIFNWESSKNKDGSLIYQLINASFYEGHLEWNFNNIFSSPENIDFKEIVLKGHTKIIPEKWSYHVLSFNSDTGLLEYKVDGTTEDLIFVTSNGFENGELFFVNLGVPSQVEICSNYTGEIDDFRISRNHFEFPTYQSAENAGKMDFTMYVPQGGRFVTKPIIVSKGSKLNSLTAQTSIPSQTEICFYVRSGDNYYDWTDNYPEWKPVQNGEKISDVAGLYFQVAAELFPDGNGEKTPSITQITLDYTEIPLPLPPFVVKAVAENGKVTVSWNYSVDDTVGGYYLYYGNRPGEYLGRIAIEGESPINVGSVSSFTVSGLENGRIYYFAVAAWSIFDENIIGNLSKEVFARPLARY